MPRTLTALLLGCLMACTARREPEPLLGIWYHGQERIEFQPGGKLRLHSSVGVLHGTYAHVAPWQVRVDLGQRWPSGEHRYWYAMSRGDQLGLCELLNGRHCMRFARHGATLRIPPR